MTNPFTHKIAQAWAEEATGGPLPAWKKKLLLGHLAKCGDCRSIAASLAEFNYGFSGIPKRPALEREVMHRGVMAAFAREFAEPRPSPVFILLQPAFRPMLVAAMAVGVFASAFLYFSEPPQMGGMAAPGTKNLIVTPQPTPTSEPASPTPSPTASPSFTPTPEIKTESK